MDTFCAHGESGAGSTAALETDGDDGCFCSWEVDTLFMSVVGVPKNLRRPLPPLLACTAVGGLGGLDIRPTAFAKLSQIWLASCKLHAHAFTYHDRPARETPFVTTSAERLASAHG